MKVTMDQALDGVLGYLSEEVAKVQHPVKKFAAIFSLEAMRTNREGTVAKYRPMLETAGVITADGCVDVDAVQKGLEKAFAAVPTLTVFGFDFTQADVAPVVAHMRQGR